jgi:hypothetical protein
MADGSLQHLRPLQGRHGAAGAAPLRHGCGGGWASLRRERLMEVARWVSLCEGAIWWGGVGRDW